MTIGDKLKDCAFCQLPYMAFEGAKNTIYGNTQGVRKILFLFLSSPSSPSSLDNDTFTLTCHQCINCGTGILPVTPSNPNTGVADGALSQHQRDIVVHVPVVSIQKSTPVVGA